jgi:hypothetical protein
MLTESGRRKSPTFERLWPFEYARPLDTVFRQSRSVGDGANREHRRRRQHVHLTHRNIVKSLRLRHRGQTDKLTEHS